MFKISEFSRLSKVSLKALRYYDHIGMLKPRTVDQDTGYRYYSADQILELNRIFMYKELGFTLPQIIELLNEDITLEQIRGMFNLKRSEIQQVIDTEQAKLTRIKERMQLIEKEGCVEREQEVVIKAVEHKLFLSLKARGKEQDIPGLFRTFNQWIRKENLNLVESPKIVIWSELDENVDEFEFEVGHFLKGELSVLPDELQIRSLPPELMATLTFHSDSAFACTACVDLATWIENNGYQIKEDQPGREIYLPLPTEQDIQLIEIQIPIKGGGED
ncbi:MerR family transcriptional regulator [Paenibacillus donghaensis]|uniref:Transcriptional regulator n=1 Tax=Paenibacillus donghaensis TaxID=414771 RepID=A0A2Z2K6N5_9BACL|nr:MerR family transcriptional regulator [Paenibacillus donghaensis]ASA20534.1 transcriptional regulator [Paenibacillus donghaensis]